VRGEVYQMVAFAKGEPANAGAKAKQLTRKYAEQPVKFSETADHLIRGKRRGGNTLKGEMRIEERNHFAI